MPRYRMKRISIIKKEHPKKIKKGTRDPKEFVPIDIEEYKDIAHLRIFLKERDKKRNEKNKN